MFNKNIPFLLFTILAVCLFPPMLFSEELKGRIVDTYGKSVDIELDGNLLPQIGDSVSIGFNMAHIGFIAHEGQGEVTALPTEKSGAALNTIAYNSRQFTTRKFVMYGIPGCCLGCCYCDLAAHGYAHIPSGHYSVT